MYRVSKDITNLDIAIGAAANKLSFAPTRRAMLDIISPALNIYDQSSVIEFVQREKNLLKKKGFTTLLVVESGAHDERTITTLKHLSDGVLVLEKGGKGKLTFRVEALSGMKFNQKVHQVKVTKKGLEIVNRVVLEHGASIPETSSRVLDIIRTRLEKELGIEEIGSIRVHVVRITHEEPAKEKPEETALQVPR